MTYYFYYQEKITCLCCDDEGNEKNFYIGNINSLTRYIKYAIICGDVHFIGFPQDLLEVILNNIQKEFDIYDPPINGAEGPYQILRRKRGR